MTKKEQMEIFVQELTRVSKQAAWADREKNRDLILYYVGYWEGLERLIQRFGFNYDELARRAGIGQEASPKSSDQTKENKDESPFDVLAEHAITEYKAGRTRSLEDVMNEIKEM